MAIPPPNFNRPAAPIPGAIPRPGGVPARPPGAAGIPPRPNATPAPATQALPTVATSTSALHPTQTSALDHAARRFSPARRRPGIRHAVQEATASLPRSVA